MKIRVVVHGAEKTIFHLNVGGFTIKNCRWFPGSRSIRFPVRYDKRRVRHPVVHVHGWQLRPLRQLLDSGGTETPRDRRPCNFKIHFCGCSRREYPEWRIFDFTVRGFTILGCRWQPSSGSIQLPVTFAFDLNRLRHAKKRVVCAHGPHINRLRRALEAKWFERTGQVIAQTAEAGVPG
jgi:hypothetical protein